MVISQKQDISRRSVVLSGAVAVVTYSGGASACSLVGSSAITVLGGLSFAEGAVLTSQAALALAASGPLLPVLGGAALAGIGAYLVYKGVSQINTCYGDRIHDMIKRLSN